MKQGRALVRPDDVVFVEQLRTPRTGKLSKITLREQFKDYPADGVILS